jgi:hypothetical protein
MRCRLYNLDGRLVHDGPCGMRRDGAIEMPAGRQEAIRPGDALFTLEEGSRRYRVQITAAHAPRDPALGDVVVYHLKPLASDA